VTWHTSAAALNAQINTLIKLILFISEESVYADPVRKVQEELYHSLLAIREGLYQTVKTACEEVESKATGAVKQESKVIVVEDKGDSGKDIEITALKTENKKLNYRIKHLLTTIDEIEGKSKQ